MNLTYIGHACFKLEGDNFSVVFDPYEDGSVPGLKNVRETATDVLISHNHHDHSAGENVRIIRNGADNSFVLRKIRTFHDEEQGAKRGENLIHIVEAEGLKIIHFGDIGHIPDKNVTDELKNADIVLLPVGGFYTIDAKAAKKIADIIKPGIIIPMHYRGQGFGYEVLGEVKDFSGLFINVDERKNSDFQITKEKSNEIVATLKDTGETSVIVLKPKNLSS